MVCSDSPSPEFKRGAAEAARRIADMKKTSTASVTAVPVFLVAPFSSTRSRSAISSAFATAHPDRCSSVVNSAGNVSHFSARVSGSV